MTDVAHRGVGWNTSKIGIFLSIRGVFVLIVQMIYVPYVRKHGAVKAFRTGCLVFAPSLLLISFITLAAQHAPGLVWPVSIFMGCITTLGASFRLVVCRRARIDQL